MPDGTLNGQNLSSGENTYLPQLLRTLHQIQRKLNLTRFLPCTKHKSVFLIPKGLNVFGSRFLSLSREMYYLLRILSNHYCSSYRKLSSTVGL